MADRIRIRLKAFDHWVVDQTAADIVRTAQKTRAAAVRDHAEVTRWRIAQARPRAAASRRESARSGSSASAPSKPPRTGPLSAIPPAIIAKPKTCDNSA